MKVVHYLLGLPPVHKGGLPEYVLSLVSQQSTLGYDVKILIPGPFTKSGETKIEKWKAFGDIACYRIINPLPVVNSYGIRDFSAFTRCFSMTCFANWLVEQKVDIIHVHSLMGLPVELLQAAKKIGIKIIMTTHDFFGLCPKVDLMQGETVCREQDWSKCYECCKGAYDIRRLRFNHSDLYWWYCNQAFLFDLAHSRLVDKIKSLLRRMRDSHTQVVESPVEIETGNTEAPDYAPLRNYYQNMFRCVDYFLFNSKQTENVYRQYLNNPSGEVIHVSNSSIRDSRVKKEFGDVLQLGYVGSKTANKGYWFLMDQLQKLYDSGKTKFVCHSFLTENDIEYPFVVNHGPYQYGEQENIYKNIDVLIVPSVWKETFGLVVLEALSCGVPVFVSENVGAKRIIKEHSGVGKVFALSGDDLMNILNEIYDNRSILACMNQEIINMEYDFSMDLHVSKVEAAYNKVLNKSVEE